MAIVLNTPDVGRLSDVVNALREWQSDASPIQLHPGDLGWNWRFGAAGMADALRTWSRDGQILAIGFLDAPEVLRMTVAPELWRDDELARQVVADLADSERGVLPVGKVSVETPDGTRVRDLLADAGWSEGEPWTPLRRGFAEPMEQTSLRIEVVEPGHESAFTAVHRAAWESARFTDELWRTMAGGLPFADARCLLGYNDDDVPVAGVTVWAAGAGRPGLLEPVGVHIDHRRRGYGRAISLAAAAELQKMGSSSALVCTQSALTSAVATYKSAGFRPGPERLDRTRDA